MALSVKCSMSKPKDLSGLPVILMLGDRDGWVREAHWSVSIAESVSSRFSERHCLNEMRW